ncbi:Fc.00g009030.m01.CDS01 [Cosmosporella sp. VM-42]
MRRVDHMVDELGPDWEEDSIYCEATCRPEDVLYEGSENEDYDNPTSRRLRYEAAGQRFLDGGEPLLLTASLRGPFDKASGWVNPWRSKNRTARASQGAKVSPGKLIRQRRPQRAVSIPETTQGETQDSLECHLPSPESLKQAPAHPYLEEDELAMVQNWRSTVQPTSLSKDGFWVSTPKEKESVRKRKARGSGWLKKLATKRRRTDIMEVGSVNTPVPRRSQTTQSHDETAPTIGLNTSFGSAPAQLPSSDARSSIHRRVSNLRSSFEEHDVEDELIEPAQDDWSAVSGQSSSSIKRISPRRDIQKPNPHGTNNNFEDELSSDQIAAAATLSSPVSQRKCPPTSSQRSHAGQQLLQHDLMRQSPSQMQSTDMNGSIQRRERGSIAAQVTELMADSFQEIGVEPHQDFETQEDQSFLFRMRPRVSDSGELEVVSEQAEACPTGSSLSSWSGLSSEDETRPLLDAEDASSASHDVKISGLKDVDANMPDLDGASVENDDAATSTSGLSSLSSEEFEGFESTIPETKNASDVETESDTSDDDSQDATEDTVEEVAQVVDDIIEDSIQVAVEETTGDSEQAESCSVESVESVESAVVTLPASSSTAGGVTIGLDNDAMETMQHENSGIEISDYSSLTSMGDQEIEDLAPSRKTTSSLTEVIHGKPENPVPGPPQGALLLKNAVTRLVPMSSWARLSRFTGSPRSSPASEAKAQTNPKNQRDAAPPATDSDSSEDELITETESESEGSNSDSDYERDASESNGRTSSNSVDHTETPSVQDAEQAFPHATDAMDIETIESQPLPCSQQSPWVGSKLSQFASMAMGRLPQDDHNRELAVTPQKVDKVVGRLSPEAQTPWTHDTVKLAMAAKLPAPEADEREQVPSVHQLADVITTPGVDGPAKNLDDSVTPAITPRPLTPEPQFSVKSFASFMSPSPERRPRQLPHTSWKDSGSRLPSTQGILASATKNPWSANSNRRVSWAPLPNEGEGAPTSAVSEDLQLSSQSRGRQASPPPLTPITDLPTGKDSKFHNHFTAITRRTNVLRQRLLPTESQRTVGTPDPQAMAEKFIQVDEVMNHHSDEMEVMDVAEDSNDAQPLPKMKNAEPSQESLDIVEDVFREMSDYLGTWNVDTDLEQARAESGVQKSISTSVVQSPW